MPTHAHEPILVADNLNVILLAGGVGGAKLADGLAQLLPPERLTVLVNTGDDFVHCGLTICPDIDTVMYTLAGRANSETGWGRAGESWRAMEEVGRLGGPEWFKLGDLDLATHLTRSHLLAEGMSLTEVTGQLVARLGAKARILPMSDQPAPTMIRCDEGLLPFQTWFVERSWQPAVREVNLPDDVRASGQVLWALEKVDLILIAPSNPFVSIEPILNVYPVREMIADLPRAVVAVSPIVAGQALKGPAAKMMGELGMAVSASAVAGYYGELIDVFVYDRRDDEIATLPAPNAFRTDTIMQNRAGRRRLAAEILAYVVELINQ
ncbi:MAG: 2-phospho-L-lactate transferase [Chloroflexota bacterium]|nr:MAG: 2-phospho-L-lactate transferase [Chloroflexota bacterium]